MEGNNERWQLWEDWESKKLSQDRAYAKNSLEIRREDEWKDNKDRKRNTLHKYYGYGCKGSHRTL